MQRFFVWVLFTLHLCSTINPLFSQTTVNKIKKPFTNNELLEYDVYYKWGLFFVDAGWVNFSVTKEEYKNKIVYHFKGYGKNKPNWDWFYKVNDVYESFADTLTLKPYRYIRNSNDGGFWVFNDTHFDHTKNLAYSIYKNKKKPTPKYDTIKTNYLTFDPISMIYYARSINFNNYKPNDVIPISLYLDGEMYYKSIKYIGKEDVKTVYGTITCIKFKPSLIAGTLFKDGDEMTVWVTDDENKIPVLVETPIIVGSIKTYLKRASGTLKPIKTKP